MLESYLDKGRKTIHFLRILRMVFPYEVQT